MGLDSNPAWARLSESKKRRVLLEVSERAEEGAEEAAKQISNATGEDIDKTDMNAFITALVGASGAASRFTGPFGLIYANAVNVGLIVKFFYDMTQAFNAAYELDEFLKSKFGASKSIFYFPLLSNASPLTKSEIQQIRDLDPNAKKILKRLAISFQQYLVRAMVSFANALDIIAALEPTQVTATMADFTLSAMAAALVAARADKMMIVMNKLFANILQFFPSIVNLGNRDDIIGDVAKFTLGGPYAIHNLGAVYRALGILEPGTGDELEQYLDMQDAGVQGVERDLSQYGKEAASFKKETDQNFKDIEAMMKDDEEEDDDRPDLSHLPMLDVSPRGRKPMSEKRVRRIIRSVLKERLNYNY
jgi:hypothetical protein